MIPLALRIRGLAFVAQRSLFFSGSSRSCASATGPIDRIIRFVGEDGKVYTGEEPSGNGKPAAVLAGEVFGGSLRRTGETMKVSKLLSPLVPTDIFCIGLNYMRHYEESAKKRGIPLPDKPPVWLSPSSSLLHPNEDIWMPNIQYGEQLDWENELTIVIGKECRNVKKEDALSYVFGYTVGIDVTSRHWQKNAGAGQWTKGKSLDTFKPLGPVLVSARSIPDPQILQLTTRVNGVVQQNENTNDMIFTCAEIIEWLSDNQTLLPGTVILIGTPSGVAVGRSPPNFLKVGDSLECEISGIGSLHHGVVMAPK